MVDFVERNPKDPNKRSKPKPPPPATGRPKPKPKKIHEADLQVKCPECGRTFGVLTALAGSEAVCPGCSKPVQVPKPGSAMKKPETASPQRSKPKPAPTPAEKKARDNSPSGEGKKKASIRKERPKVDLKTQPKCPECEAVLEADAVLCVKCGYDLRKKQQNVTARKKSINPVIPIIVLLALVGGSYAVYEFVLKPKDDTPTSPPTTAVNPIAQEPESDPITEPASFPAIEESVAEVDVQPDPIPELEPEPEVEAVVEPGLTPEPVVEAEPEPVVEEPVAIEAPLVDPRKEIRQLMVEKMDKQYPVAGVGDSVSLTALDGTEYTGSLTSIEGSTLSIQQNGSEVILQTKTLERRSRARLDAAYRNAMIDQLTNKYMARKAAN